MLELKRTDSGNKDFVALVTHLDAYLAILDGEEHAFYNSLNKTDTMRFVLVAYYNGEPAGCGAIREYEPGTMEIKRMYVVPEKRGLGIAGNILSALEDWAKELGAHVCILETGKKQLEAIQLYQKSRYTVVPNYGKYEKMENSVCFSKKIK